MKKYRILRILAEIVEKIYKIEISPENEKNLNSVKDVVTHSSLIVYFNHISLDDPVIVLYLLVKYCGDKINDIYAPESRKHFEFTRSPLNAIFLRFGSLLGFKLYPVVQHYDKINYSKGEQQKLLSRFYRDTKKGLSEIGNVLLIAPEGTRSPNGKLQQAQKGIEKISQSIENTYFLPIGLYWENNQGSRNYNFGRKYIVNVGKPFFNNGHYSADSLMKILASYLPKDMRGLYSTFT
ncbi:MAG: 1-acyl-sn-glycerol-3-phosphate acyltransferase [Candidatus Aenigmatarchaeota archaeon]